MESADISITSQASERQASGSKARWWLALSLLISIATGLIAGWNRLPWSDEGEFSSASYNLAHHGFMGTTVLEPQGSGLTRIDQRTYWVMPLYLVTQAAWYKFFPATIGWTRAYTVLVWGLLMLAAFRAFLSRLELAPGVATLGTCLLATSYVFIDNAAFARPDIMCAALGIAGLAAYVRWREEHFYRALFASNLLVAASGLTHPNGVFHFAGLVAVVLWFDRRRLDAKALGMAALPYLLAGGLWGLYIGKDTIAFRDQLAANSTNHRLPDSFSPVKILSEEIRRYLVTFGLITRGVALMKVYSLAAYLAAVAGCLATPKLRRTSGVRLLLMLLAVYFVAMCLFNQKLSYYLVHILPFYIALLAAWVCHLWESRRRWRPLLAFAVFALVVVDPSGILLRAVTRRYQGPQRAAVAFIEAHSKPDDRIDGSSSLVYELGFDNRLRDDPYLGLQSGRLPDMVVIETLYRVLYDAWDVERPREMQQIHNRLKLYRLAYKSGDYEVYLLRGTS